MVPEKKIFVLSGCLINTIREIPVFLPSEERQDPISKLLNGWMEPISTHKQRSGAPSEGCYISSLPLGLPVTNRQEKELFMLLCFCG